MTSYSSVNNDMAVTDSEDEETADMEFEDNMI